MPVDQEMERTPYSSESFRVRCPHCRKLYLVQFADVRETKPRFECSQCHDRFWLSLPDMDLSSEVIGLPVQVKEAPVASRPAAPTAETESCPKCFKANAVHARECKHCGVVIAKARAAALSFEEPLPAHSPSLAKVWKKVVDDYGNDRGHTEFIRLAQMERCLPYAAFQYGQMHKLMPADETTKARINEVRALAEGFLPAREEPKLASPRMYPRLWQIPLFGAALLIVVGLAVPMLRNIVGVGAAFLFLAIALQIQLRKK